ncbi:ATP-binding protein [Streptomyces hydrogenans]|uniref:ATP-binding protein n=1 Tax=Streptomyces hydrogenans TaxID=1873719 RepID=UPI0033301987
MGRWGSFSLPAQRGADPSATIDAACQNLGLGGELPPEQADRGLRLLQEPQRPARGHQNPRPARLAPGRQPALPDRRLRRGESHLLIGLGTAIAEAGGRVRYTTAANLVNELAETASDKQLGRTINKYGQADLLCLDELGYVKLDRHGAELLFQIFTEREERHAIAIASNRPFTEWDQTFTDKRLCQAVVDRLTFEAHIIETGTQSFRLASTTAKRKATAA